jgi:hypothetical protein
LESIWRSVGGDGIFMPARVQYKCRGTRIGNKPAAANMYVLAYCSLVTAKYLCATVIDLVHPWASNVLGIGLLCALASSGFDRGLVADLQ